MSFKAMAAQGAIVGVPATNLATNNGIITALQLENYVLFGFTFGAIFQLLTAFSVLLIVLINLNKLGRETVRFWKRVFKSKEGGG